MTQFALCAKRDGRPNLCQSINSNAPIPSQWGREYRNVRADVENGAVNQMALQHWLRRRFRPSVWHGWPELAYQQEAYQRRLSAVQQHLTESLDCAPSGSLRIISMCAGDGRDVIGVLKSHRRRQDVATVLVELNCQSIADGAREMQTAGLQNNVEFLNADATAYETYKHLGPANIVLLCGVWGHVPASERVRLIGALTSLCLPGGTVIWTRGIAKGLERFHEIQATFPMSSWKQDRVTFTSDQKWAVVSHRFLGTPTELPSSGPIFRFQTGVGTR